MSARSAADPAPPINQSVERAAAMLAEFTVDDPELTLAQLTSRLGTSRATTHRYAMALRRVGLLRYDRARAVYTLGPRIVELATSALAGLRIIKVAGPYMERLVGDVNETVVLSIWDGEAPVVVRVDDNTDRLVRINVRTGSRLPPETSAQGKIFAAFGGGNGSGGEEGAAIRRAGMSSNAMVVEGICAIAVPVFQGEELVAAMAIVGTTASVQTDPGAAMCRDLRATAAALSTELGFVPNPPTEGSER
ncbi:MAG TPA: IclR family transcriptional regulator [Gaiellales bacterium]|nr:IclR family transcriptional regulator [Gaiellales bacterium]